MKTPFNVLRHVNQWEMAPRDPVTIGAMILGSMGSAGVSIATWGIVSGINMAFVVGYLATTAITSWALSQLSPTPSIGGSRGLLVNGMDGTAPHDYIYGTMRKGGTRTYTESTGTDNKFLHMIICVAGHEVDYVNFYVNDEIATLDGNGFVTSGNWNSKIRIKAYDGSQTTADPDGLLAESSQIDSTFVGNGIAYLYVRLEYDQDVFANGVPTFTTTVQGRRVYDLRTASTAYSANAALCVRDYLTSDIGLADPDTDDTIFASQANVCDEDVDLATTGVQPRYECHGVFSADMAPREIVTRMMTSCAGTLFWGQGAWQLRVGYYTAPVKTFTLADLRGGISVNTKVASRDNFNRVTGTFVSANDGYVVTEYPPIESDEFLANDKNIENTLDLALPFTTSDAAAQRLAKMTLFRGREQITVSADFGLEAFGVQVGDVVALDIDRYGWSSKEFEVVGWSFNRADGGEIVISMSLRETSPAAFAWNAEESAITRNNTNLPDFRYVPPVGINIIGGELREANQQVVGVALVDVSIDPLFASSIEFQYRKTGASKWRPSGSTLNPASLNSFEVVGISDGSFDFRARATNVLGIHGPWKTLLDNYITIFAFPPADIEDFAGNVVGNTLHLTWSPVADLDLSHYKIRYSTKKIGASYQNARNIVKKVSRPANSITVPAQTGTYFIKAIDKLGNPSRNPASFVVVTNTADIDNLNVITTLPQNPIFAGVKTNTVLLNDDDGNYIALDTVTQFDDVSGVFDDQVGLFDGGGTSGVMASSGVYEFDDFIDLGGIYVSRVSTAMDILLLDYANTFDSAGGEFDQYEGYFDGDPTQFDFTSARAQVSTTNDAPASDAAVWTGWHDFIVGDIAARGIRFRVILESSRNNLTPAIRELSAIVDMPDKVESADDITFVGSYVVTFPSAFKAKPSIGIAATLADGDRYAISGKSRTGFTITAYTGGSVSSNSMTFDYIAKGYGKELA